MAGPHEVTLEDDGRESGRERGVGKGAWLDPTTSAV
jgi:hypothetical protein